MIPDNIRQIICRVPSAWGTGDVEGHPDVAQWLIKTLQPKVTVELGVDMGYSLICFACNNPGHVYGIDNFEGDPIIGYKDTSQSVIDLIKKTDLQNITLIKGYFSEVAKAWDSEIDILHIDGCHQYEDVKNDFETWSKFVNESGVILFHDTIIADPRFGVKKFFSEIELPKVEFTNNCGLGVVSKNVDLIESLRKFR